ncbi:MAG: YdcF family protein [Actinomycetaceae bacterium]|nr:YdcF family protein [Actinomycetaceae bacterium]
MPLFFMIVSHVAMYVQSHEFLVSDSLDEHSPETSAHVSSPSSLPVTISSEDAQPQTPEEHVSASAGSFIYDGSDFFNKEFIEKMNVDYLIVLGASVSYSSPSKALKERLRTAVMLYNKGVAPRILVTGDGSTSTNNEPKVMRAWLENNGIPSEAIVEDGQGYSTMESMKRAKNVYHVKRPVVVTQDFHILRSVYDARAVGMEAWGCATVDDNNSYTKSYMREKLAIVKDYWLVQSEKR